MMFAQYSNQQDVLEVDNIGNAPLSIANVTGSLGISAFSWTSMVIPPGGAAVLVITWDTTTRGTFSGPIAFTSDATSGQTTSDYTVTVNVNKIVIPTGVK